MKTFSALVLILILVAFSPKKEVEITLEEALKQGKVSMVATGNNGSTHYLKPLQIELKNNTSNKVVIRINSGYRFLSEDSTVQDIVITEDELIALNPHENHNATLSGMCVQRHNSAPCSDDAFAFGGYAAPALRAFAAKVDSAHWQNSQAQQAMWVLSDGRDLANIYTYGDDAEWQIVVAAARAAKLPVPDRQAFMAEQAKRSGAYANVRGSFKFKFSQPVAIHIALFDENNIVLQEIYRETAQPGSHQVTYEFDALPYQGQTLFARFIARDDVLLERTIAL